MKVAIFGGSFNPIHNDHIKIMIDAKKSLKIDQIWIIPAKKSPLKSLKLASVKHRINMIKIAIKNFDWIKIKDFEIRRNDKISFTIDTLKFIKNKYKNIELFLIIGADQANNFDKWEESEEIRSLSKIIVYPRVNYKINDKIISKYNMKVMNLVLNKISSTDIRKGNNWTKSLTGDLINYININNVYVDNIIFEKLSYKRYTHSHNVATLAKKLAKKWNVDQKEAYAAGAYHDVCKEISLSEQRKIISKYFKNILNEPSQIWHGYVGSVFLNHDLSIKSDSILNSIKFHTVPRINSTDIEKIIFLADKLSKERSYQGISQLRILAFKDITLAFKMVLKSQYLKAINNHGEKNIGNLMLTTYNYYIN